MLMKKLQTVSLQAFHFERDRFIRATDPVAKLEQKRGNAAHATAGYADEMNAVALAREKLREIELC